MLDIQQHAGKNDDYVYLAILVIGWLFDRLHKPISEFLLRIFVLGEKTTCSENHM